MSMELVQLTKELNINASNDDVFNCLYGLTDDDYNGANGKGYVPIKTDLGHTKYISKLEKKVMKLNKTTNIKQFIKEVINEAFADENCFPTYRLSITDVYDSLIITVSVVVVN